MWVKLNSRQCWQILFVVCGPLITSLSVHPPRNWVCSPWASATAAIFEHDMDLGLIAVKAAAETPTSFFQSALAPYPGWMSARISSGEVGLSPLRVFDRVLVFLTTLHWQPLATGFGVKEIKLELWQDRRRREQIDRRDLERGPSTWQLFISVMLIKKSCERKVPTQTFN